MPEEPRQGNASNARERLRALEGPMPDPGPLTLAAYAQMVPSLEDAAARTLAELWAQDEQLRTHEPLQRYEPIPATQRKFHEATHAERWWFSGNQSGKSTASILEAIFHATGEYPSWYPEAGKLRQPTRGRIISTDFQKGIGEVIAPLLGQWLPARTIQRTHKNPQGVLTKVELWNGSTFDCLTHEQPVQLLEGWSGHWSAFDEPPPHGHYIATQRGLVAKAGRLWGTATPLHQPWLFDAIWERQDHRPDLWVLSSDIRANPYLSEARIAAWEATLTEDEKEARLHGRFRHLSGLIYKSFRKDLHIVPPSPIPASWTRYMGLDPHPRKPTVAIWLAVSPGDEWVVYDELVAGGLGLAEWVGLALAKEARHGGPIERRVMDPHWGWKDTLGGGINFQEEFARYGLYCTPGNDNVDLGIVKIQQALDPQWMPLAKTMRPRLTIMAHCPTLIYEFQHHLWDEYIHEEKLGAKEKPSKRDRDLLDSLRYLVMANPTYVERSQQLPWDLVPERQARGQYGVLP